MHNGMHQPVKLYMLGTWVDSAAPWYFLASSVLDFVIGQSGSRQAGR